MRLIDADALTNKCGDWYIEEGTEEGFIGSLKQLIDKQPTIEAEPVKHGKWIEIIEANELGEPYQSGVCCSECGHTDSYEQNYCPDCGARMDEE